MKLSDASCMSSHLMWLPMHWMAVLSLQSRLVVLTLISGSLASCEEKQSIDEPAYVSASRGSTGTGSTQSRDQLGDKKGPKGGTVRVGGKADKTGGTASDDLSDGTKEFSICNDGLGAHGSLKDFGIQVAILCDDGKLEAVLDQANVYTGGDRKLYETDKKIGDLQTTFKIYSGGAYESDPEDYWNLLKLQFIKPKVFRDNYLDDPNARMDLVVPGGESVTYRYFNNSGEGGVIEYDGKTDFVTLSQGKAWVAVTQKVGPTRETMESLKSLQVVFASASYPGKTAVVSISDQTYKHASGQGQSYYDRAMNNLTTEQKNGFTNAKTSKMAKQLLIQ